MWPLWLVEMSLQHIQKNSPRLLPKPAKFEKNPPNGYRVIRKTKCGAGGAAGARCSPIHKQASLAGRLINEVQILALCKAILKYMIEKKKIEKPVVLEQPHNQPHKQPFIHTHTHTHWRPLNVYVHRGIAAFLYMPTHWFWHAEREPLFAQYFWDRGQKTHITHTHSNTRNWDVCRSLASPQAYRIYFFFFLIFTWGFTSPSTLYRSHHDG